MPWGLPKKAWVNTDTYDGTAATRAEDGIAQALDVSSGTLASRPAASTSNYGSFYLATDQNGGTMFRSNGTTWIQYAPGVNQPGGQELSSATVATDFTLTNTVANSPTAVTGLSQTFTAPGGSLRFQLTLPCVMLTANAGIWKFKVWDGAIGSGTMLFMGIAQVNTAATFPLVSVTTHKTLSAASHTLNVSYESDTVGVNGAIWGSAIAPFDLTVVKP